MYNLPRHSKATPTKALLSTGLELKKAGYWREIARGLSTYGSSTPRPLNGPSPLLHTVHMRALWRICSGALTRLKYSRLARWIKQLRYGMQGWKNGQAWAYKHTTQTSTSSHGIGMPLKALITPVIRILNQFFPVYSKVPYLMLSGADDGQFSIWDLRAFKS